MRIKGLDYETFSDQQFPNMQLIRAWRGKKAWAAGDDNLLIVMVDDENKFASLVEYDYAEDRQAEIHTILNEPDWDGGSGTGITAPILPTPPTRSGGYEEEVPVELGEEGSTRAETRRNAG